MPTHRPTRGNECRIVLMGDPRVGKTALLSQLTDGHLPEAYEPTLLDCAVYSEAVDGTTYRVEVVDCASDSDFAVHRSPYIETADVIVLVYSILDERTLHSLKGHAAEVVRVRLRGVDTTPTADIAAALNADPEGGARFSPSSTSSVGTVSRSPYRREVPLFLVGTHADVVRGDCRSSGGGVEPAHRLVDRAVAEGVAEECLRQVGLRAHGAAVQEVESRKVGKKIRSVWKSVFGRSSEDKAEAADSVGGGAGKPAVPRRDPSGGPSAADSGLAPERTLPVTPLSPETVVAVPSGASARLPLYELSAGDPTQVRQLFQALVRLHVLMHRPPSPQSRGSGGGGGSGGADLHDGSVHFASLSIGSSVKSAAPGEPLGTPELPEVSSLYNLSGCQPSVYDLHGRDSTPPWSPSGSVSGSLEGARPGAEVGRGPGVESHAANGQAAVPRGLPHNSNSTTTTTGHSFLARAAATVNTASPTACPAHPAQAPTAATATMKATTAPATAPTVTVTAAALDRPGAYLFPKTSRKSSGAGTATTPRTDNGPSPELSPRSEGGGGDSERRGEGRVGCGGAPPGHPRRPTVPRATTPDVVPPLAVAPACAEDGVEVVVAGVLATPWGGPGIQPPLLSPPSCCMTQAWVGSAVAGPRPEPQMDGVRARLAMDDAASPYSSGSGTSPLTPSGVPPKRATGAHPALVGAPSGDAARPPRERCPSGAPSTTSTLDRPFTPGLGSPRAGKATVNRCANGGCAVL